MRLLVLLSLDRYALSRLLLLMLQVVALGLYRLGWSTLARFALSAIFNLRYYQGVADELGGRERFFGLRDGL